MAFPTERMMLDGFSFETINVDGVPLPAFMLDQLKTLKSRDVRDDDIFLRAYLKSGTHWVWEILNMIVSGKAEYAKHWKNSTSLEHRTEKELDALPSPRILNCHLQPRMLPAALWRKKCKIVYVQTHPKDCVVSFYCQCINQVIKDNKDEKTNFTGTWDEFLNAFLQNRVPFGSWFDYVKEWATISTKHPDVSILQVQYEDLKRDCVKEIKRLAEYIGHPLSEETCGSIAEACRFQKLKNANENEKDQKYHFKWKEDSQGYFRKGVVDDWKKWFTVAQSERFDRVYDQSMRQMKETGHNV